MKILPRSFYERDTAEVAQDLLGKVIVRTFGTIRVTGIIVETEAYYADDPACHAYRGKTKANEALFGKPGHAYIYFIYGNHFCLNFVAYQKCAGGVLIRALEPVEGSEIMQKNRKHDIISTNLTNGPGKLAQALAITKELYGIDVTTQGPLYVTQGVNVPHSAICSTTRIGISKAQEKKWRFYVCSNPFVSRT